MGIENKYCAFIDVLGYGALVKNSQHTTEQKVKMLNSIYTNLATQFSLLLPEINSQFNAPIYMRSFSDCFYLDCDALEPLLVFIKSIYDYAFGFYASFSETEEKTPLLRCGIVKDWVIKFKDIGALANNTQELNPVGLAVVRAYQVSEKSRLSGMRIIISPEIIADLNVLEVLIEEFPCFVKEINTYNISLSYHFKQIKKNEDGEQVDLYEMLWPVSRANNECFNCIAILKKIKQTFTFGTDERRHFDKTVELFIDSLRLTSNCYWNPEKYSSDRQELIDLIQL